MIFIYFCLTVIRAKCLGQLQAYYDTLCYLASEHFDFWYKFYIKSFAFKIV